MIVRLTNVAAQTLGASLRPSWRTSTLGTSGKISKLTILGIIFWFWQAAAAGWGGKRSKVGVARLLPLAAPLQPGRGSLPCREVGEQQRRQLQLLPLWLQLQHRSGTAPSHQNLTLTRALLIPRWGVQPHRDQGADAQRLCRPLGKLLSPAEPTPVLLFD